MTWSTPALSVSRHDANDALTIDGHSFPALLHCNAPQPSMSATVAWCAEQAQALRRLATERGAVLLRGFPVRRAVDLDAVVAAFGGKGFPYAESLSNAVRINHTPRVFTANEAPAGVTIHLHHEMAQTPIFPRWLFFACLEAPRSGGETPLCRSDELWRLVEQELPAFAQACRERGLRYTTIMPGSDDAASGLGRSWQSTFGVQTRSAAEARLLELGYDWDWQADSCLRARTPRLPAVRSDDLGRTTFFNQLIAAFKGWRDARNDPSRAVTFGDETPIDPEVVASVAALAERCTWPLAWQVGDVALLDNVVVMHGRMPFAGSRQVLAALVDACRVQPLTSGA